LQQTNTVKYFTNTSLKMLFKHTILAALFVSSIMATLTQEEMATTLIAENEENLVQTFKKFKEQNEYELSSALADVSKVQEHIPKVVICLRTVVDPFPKEMSNVSDFVHSTLCDISYGTRDDPESFTNVITSFVPCDAKLFASIRQVTIWRDDVVKVLKSVMAKSPELITGDLPRWLASHPFGRGSCFYIDSKNVRRQAFQYLASFATERVVTDALTIVKANEHFKVDSEVSCCHSEDFPQDLYNKLNALLVFVKARNALIKETLVFLPKVLAGMVADYLPASTD